MHRMVLGLTGSGNVFVTLVIIALAVALILSFVAGRLVLLAVRIVIAAALGLAILIAIFG
jgi:hypothetical protein